MTMDTNSLALWKICEKVTLFQAVLLGIGYDPEDMGSYSFDRRKHEAPLYDAAMAALKSALLTGSIQAKRDSQPQ